MASDSPWGDQIPPDGVAHAVNKLLGLARRAGICTRAAQAFAAEDPDSPVRLDRRRAYILQYLRDLRLYPRHVPLGTEPPRKMRDCAFVSGRTVHHESDAACETRGAQGCLDVGTQRASRHAGTPSRRWITLLRIVRCVIPVDILLRHRGFLPPGPFHRRIIPISDHSCPLVSQGGLAGAAPPTGYVQATTVSAGDRDAVAAPSQKGRGNSQRQ
jgi:hypothetical protein